MLFLVALIGLMLINQQAAGIDFDTENRIQGTLHHLATAIGATTAVLLLSNPISIPEPSLLFGFTSACLFGYKLFQFAMEQYRSKQKWEGAPGMLVIGFVVGMYVTVVAGGYLINFAHLVPKP